MKTGSLATAFAESVGIGSVSYLSVALWVWRAADMGKLGWPGHGIFPSPRGTQGSKWMDFRHSVSSATGEKGVSCDVRRVFMDRGGDDWLRGLGPELLRCKP